MAWIESHQALREHRKTKKLARKLGITIPTTIGHLHMLWWWAMDYAEDGNLTKFDPDDIADGVSWDGSVNFLEAAHEAGFIDYIDGEYRIHDWYEYIGRLLDKKEANKLRMREAREKERELKERAKNVQRTTKARSTLPDLTVPNQTIPNQTVPNKDIDRLIDDRPTVPIETNFDKPESFYKAHHRIFGYYCNKFQVEQLGAFIDTDGMEESVIIRALERAATAKSAYNFKFILGILNGYLKSKALTLLEAIALDEEFERNVSEKSFNKGNGSPVRQGTSRKQPLPMISDNTPSTPRSPKERETSRAMAKLLDGNITQEEYEAILSRLEEEHATVT